jgi:hypothetical protein
MRTRRCLVVKPLEQEQCDCLQQVKFDENPDMNSQPSSSILVCVDSFFGNYRLRAGKTDLSFAKSYAQVMDGSQKREEFLIASFPVDASDELFVASVGRKLLLRKSVQGCDEETVILEAI